MNAKVRWRNSKTWWEITTIQRLPSRAAELFVEEQFQAKGGRILDASDEVARQVEVMDEAGAITTWEIAVEWQPSFEASQV